MTQIIVEGLTKTYRVAVRGRGALAAVRGLGRREWRRIEALRGIDFSVAAGELVGFVGPNGAGKSTTIKILSGILRPDGGRCEVDGLVPWRERRRHVAGIGVVFGQRTQLWWDLPVGDGFDLLAAIYRVAPDAYRRTRDELVGLMRLERLLDQPVRQLSLGQKMRCEIAAAMLHSPRILFLDEPTIGLDAPAKLAVRELIGALNRERGVTVVLTTHDMQDIEALARRVIVIGRGVILADQPFAAFRDGAARERRVIAEFTAAGIPKIEMPGVREVRREGRELELVFDPGVVAAPELLARLAADHALDDIRVLPPQIEEVIARFYDLHGAGEG